MTSTRFLLRLATPALSLSLTFALTGCANLGAIQEFGRLSADTVTYQRVTDDFLASTQLQQDLTLKSQERERGEIAASHPRRQQVAQGALLMQQALGEYMDALAQLAGDDLVVLDDTVQDLADAATKARMLDAGQAQSVGSIGGLLTEAALNGYRQRQLGTVIERGNAPLQELVKQIKTMMTVYDRQLIADQEQFRQHFKSLDTRAQGREPVAAELAWMRQRLGEREFAPRRAAIASYIETIDRIGAAHQALYDNRERISSAEVHTQLKRYIKRIRAAQAAARGE